MVTTARWEVWAFRRAWGPGDNGPWAARAVALRVAAGAISLTAVVAEEEEEEEGSAGSRCGGCTTMNLSV